MEKISLFLAGCSKLFLQIEQNYSEIPVKGIHSYACIGRSVILYHVDDQFNVRAIRFFDDCFINRIKTICYGGRSVQLLIEVFTRRAGANPKIVKGNFGYEWVDVL